MESTLPIRARIPPRRHIAVPHRRHPEFKFLADTGMVLIGRWIHVARLQAGMSQGQLGRLSGLHQTTISRLERGRLEGLRLHRLAALLAVLDEALGRRMPSFLDD